MPWRGGGPAVLLRDSTGADVGHLVATSTASIRPRQSTEAALVFGVDIPQFVDNAGNEFADTDEFGSDNLGDRCSLCPGLSRWIFYCRDGGVAGEDALVLRPRASTGQYPLRPTCVDRGDNRVAA